MPGLYQTPSYYDKAQSHYGQALQGYSAAAQQRPEREKSIGGGLQSGASGASAGAMIGSSMLEGSMGGPWGAAIGAGVGLGAYLLS